MGEFGFNKTIKAKSYEDYLKQCDVKVHLVNIGEEGFYDGSVVEYDIYDVDEAKKLAENTDDVNLKFICKKFAENKGKLAEDVVGTKCVFIGLQLTHEDYYYILKNEEKTWCATCVGELKIL